MATEGLRRLGRGYMQVYTGNSKGKTTAALGLAFRAMGWGLRTYIGQFMKGQHYGELDAARMVQPHITIEQYGKDTFVHARGPSEEDARMGVVALESLPGVGAGHGEELAGTVTMEAIRDGHQTGA